MYVQSTKKSDVNLAFTQRVFSTHLCEIPLDTLTAIKKMYLPSFRAVLLIREVFAVVVVIAQPNFRNA